MITRIVLFFNHKRNQKQIDFLTKGKKTMSYVISKDDCIQCGACESECPDGAISEVDGFYVIDPAKCKDCGSCSDVCPTSSIAAA